MHILLTGCNSGIGQALLCAYLNKGVVVYGVGRQSIPAHKHQNFHYLSLDLSTIEKIEHALHVFIGSLEKIDLVILNAGILGEIEEITNTTLVSIESVMRLNVWANKVILDTLISLPLTIDQVIGISSGAAVNGNKGWSAYALSKATLNMLIQLYAHEMPQTHLSAIAPGVVDTPMVRQLIDENDAARFPSIARLKNGPIQSPHVAADRLLKAFKKVKQQYRSGSFVDVRKMG